MQRVYSAGPEPVGRSQRKSHRGFQGGFYLVFGAIYLVEASGVIIRLAQEAGNTVLGSQDECRRLGKRTRPHAPGFHPWC